MKIINHIEEYSRVVRGEEEEEEEEKKKKKKKRKKKKKNNQIVEWPPELILVEGFGNAAEDGQSQGGRGWRWWRTGRGETKRVEIRRQRIHRRRRVIQFRQVVHPLLVVIVVVEVVIEVVRVAAVSAHGCVLLAQFRKRAGTAELGSGQGGRARCRKERRHEIRSEEEGVVSAAAARGRR